MRTEQRIIKASILAGATDLLIGLFMAVSGLHEWWFNTFHLFGVLGIGMIAYGLWHAYYYKQETRERVWKDGMRPFSF